MAISTLANAIKYYNVKNYKEAFLTFKKLSKSHTEAAYYLGLMYFNGYYTNQDYNLAFKQFKKAWEGLYPDAIYMLGVCYENGRGTTKDMNQAFELYQAAAKNESVLALLKIAKFCEEGIIVKKSLKSAIEIYVRLTKFNNAYAMYKIGSFYLEGKGLKKSMDNAYTWLNKALSNGSVEAMNYFRFLGSKSKTDIRTTEEIYKTAKSYLSKDKFEQGITLLEIAAKESHLQAIFDLSNSYLKGIGVKQSASKAFKTLLKYKNLKEPELYYRIGQKYENGEGINSSYIKAVLFYELSAKLDYELAKVALAEIRGY
ncbi:MAG: sel1 repeat family protein [Tenericutes bacterium]|nr:sel1 repeat family protein [Mycoplasmatota bacterium]